MIVVVHAEAVEGAEETVLDAFLRSRATALSQPSCRAFDIHRQCDNPQRLVVVERWDSEAAHSAFFDTVSRRPEFAAFRQLLATDLDIRRATVAQDGSGRPLMTIEEVVAAATADESLISNDDLKARMSANAGLFLIDVRSKQEFDGGHMPGAVWMERGIVEFRLARMERDADREIVITCAVGNRSTLVARVLRDMGYRRVASHVGFNMWAADGLPIETYLGEMRMVAQRQLNAATNATQLR